MSKLSSFSVPATIETTDRFAFTRSGTNRNADLALLGRYGLGTIPLTAGEIASPSVDVLGNQMATYRLNVAPFTRYYSNGTILVEYPGEASGGGGFGPEPSNVQDWLQAAIDADPGSGFGQSANWWWGNRQLDGPVVVNVTDNMDGFILDGHGATFSASPAWTTPDLDGIVFQCPSSNSFEVQITGFRIQNLHFQGHNGTQRIVRNGIALLATPGIKGAFFGSSMVNVKCDNCTNSGIYFSGNVFEMSLYGVTCSDNSFAGFEVNNPTTGGIISSINVYGGDFRTNFYGIASTSGTPFQQTGGIQIWSTDFIVNASAGVRCPRGLAGIYGSHFENNCHTNAGETEGAIWSDFGDGVNIYNCNAVGVSWSGQKYLADAAQSGGAYSFITNNCFSTWNNAYHSVIKADVGTYWLSAEMTVGDVTGVGTATVNIADFTTHAAV